MIPIFRAILKHKKIVIWVTLAGFGFSALISLVIPKRYVSYGSFLPAGVSRELGGGGTILSALGEFGESYSELIRVRRNFIIEYIIRSRYMGLLMAEEFDLRRLYDIDETEKLLKELNENTSVVVRDEGVIVVGVEDQSPVRARDMVAAYLGNLDSLLIRLDRETSEERINFLEREFSNRKRKVLEVDSLIRNFMEEHGVFEIEEQIRGAYDVLADLSTEKNILEIEKGLIETELRLDNPELEKKQKQINLIDERITELLRGGEEGGFSGIPALEEIPELTNEYLRLINEKRLQEFTFTFIRIKLEDARLTSERDVSLISIIDPPYVPERRVWPKRKQIVLVSTLSVLFACCVAIAALESARLPLEPGGKDGI